MSNSFHEEKAGVFSPCIEVGENLTACYENEEEEEEGTASSPTQEIPPDASESVKPVDYSEGVVRSIYFVLVWCIQETNPLKEELYEDSMGTERAYRQRASFNPVLLIHRGKRPLSS